MKVRVHLYICRIPQTTGKEDYGENPSASASAAPGVADDEERGVSKISADAPPHVPPGAHAVYKSPGDWVTKGLRPEDEAQTSAGLSS